MQRFVFLLVPMLALAGCSGGASNSDADSGAFVLAVNDSLAGGAMELKGAYLHAAEGWIEVLGNATFAFEGTGTNVSKSENVPAGSYDRLRLLFSDVRLGGQSAALTQSGVEVLVNVTVADGGKTQVNLGFGWADAFFQSAQGLAFTPVLTSLVVMTDGVETLRLQAAEIATTAGKAPVARMRVFDPTGLEVFASTFVAESPEDPVVGNAGNLTFSATNSEVLQPGATLGAVSWDIGGETFLGNTVVWPSPINGGNYTVRLTVEDSEGNKDSQTVKMALKPGTASKTLRFTGTATGYGADSAEDHDFAVDNATYDNATAQLTHVRVVLQPGAAGLPVTDLNLALLAGGTEVQSVTGAGSQHTIDRDITGPAGTWTARVTPNPAYEADYTVTVTLTWKGVNPGIEAFLAAYEDGHSHEH